LKKSPKVENEIVEKMNSKLNESKPFRAKRSVSVQNQKYKLKEFPSVYKLKIK